jgi:hypothetical protein
VLGAAKERCDAEQMQWCRSYVRRLRDINQQQLESVTLGFLALADMYEDEKYAPNHIVNRCFGMVSLFFFAFKRAR